MGEQRLFFEDVKEGDEAPARRTRCRPHRPRALRGRLGGLQPDAPRRGEGRGRGPAERVRSRHVLDGPAGSAITDYVGVGNLTHYKVRFAKQTWPDEELVTRVVVAAKREDAGRHLVDLDVRLLNDQGEEKVVGEATAALPARA